MSDLWTTFNIMATVAMMSLLTGHVVRRLYRRGFRDGFLSAREAMQVALVKVGDQRIKEAIDRIFADKPTEKQPENPQSAQRPNSHH